LGIASFIVFAIRPGGFEGGGLWFALLLPGAFGGIFVADHVFHAAPSADRLAFYACTFTLSFAWYFLLAYAAIKSYRFVSWVGKQ